MKGCRNGKNIYIMPFASFLVILKCNWLLKAKIVMMFWKVYSV
jgi:hypothetical protein